MRTTENLKSSKKQIVAETQLWIVWVGLGVKGSFFGRKVIEVPDFPFTEAQMGLVPYERITFKNLLYGLLLNSGNDAAETLAHNIPGGKQEFIVLMNKKAKQYSLNNTHFQNVTGLESENHYTTALDLARLASIALQDEELRHIVSTKAITVRDVTGVYVHELQNINRLLDEVQGALGVKTGFTHEAGQVLVAAANRNEHTILTVVLKSEDRFLDSTNLLEWAFANHQFVGVSFLD